MFVLLHISHAALNSLENARPHLPEAIRQGEGILWQDRRGHIQAALKVEVPQFEDLKEVQNVSAAMGARVLVFVCATCNNSVVLQGPTLSRTGGQWFKLPQGERPKGVSYFMNGSYYQVRVTE